MQIITRGLLFDMDGTSIDSNPVVEANWRRFCEPRGIDLSELLKFSHGRLAIATLEKYLPHASRKELLAEEAKMLEWESNANDGVQPISGAQELFGQLVEQEIPWALVTSAAKSLARTRFEVTGLPWPEVVVTAERVHRGKPDPMGYQLAASELGLEASDCVVFEDAGPGVSAGVAAGAQVVVVGTDTSEPTRGLPRISDLQNVSLAPADMPGWYVLSL